MNTQLKYPESQPEPHLPAQPPASSRPGVEPQHTMICLALCMALQMTSFVMILPLFARRFSELGAGVNDLSISSMAYALAATVSAPFMGALSDKLGRRPILIGSLFVYVLAFMGYRFAASAPALIVLRGLAGAFTAGMMPAVTSMVADLAPADRRAQWIGMLSGAASVGWIAGPILGGLLYDRWGYGTALWASIGMAALAFALTLIAVRETHKPPLRAPRRDSLNAANSKSGLTVPPASLGRIAVILFTAFGVTFTWAFIEPRVMFYAYDDLSWSSSMLGLVMSTYGIAMMLGEFGLGQLSDKLGRKPVIVLGLVLFSAQFIGLALFRNYLLIAVAFVIAGFGNALFDPALSAAILDVAPSRHQARLLGVKSTFGSVGSILGPALVVLLTPLQAQSVFSVASGMVLLITLVAVAAGSGPIHGKETLRSEETGTQAR